MHIPAGCWLFSIGFGGQAEPPWSWLSRLKSRYHCGMGTFRWMSLYTVHSAGLQVTRAAARPGSPASAETWSHETALVDS